MNCTLRAAVAALILAIGFAGTVAAGPGEDALHAVERGDYATAMRLWRPLADQGDAKAQFSLGIMYANGFGVRQDFAAAMTWYRKAADQGDATAQYNLGRMYFDGRGVPKDYATALGWFRKAAGQGDADAQSVLGGMYVSGLGVPQDFATALIWFRKAADQGDAKAQFFLGRMYFAGDGVSQDYVAAYMWFNLAAESGLNDATRNRDMAAAKMSPTQIAEAQKLARLFNSSRATENTGVGGSITGPSARGSSYSSNFSIKGVRLGMTSRLI